MLDLVNHSGEYSNSAAVSFNYTCDFVQSHRCLLFRLAGECYIATTVSFHCTCEYI